MPRLTIALNNEMYAELERISSDNLDLGYSPALRAQEAVESALATRRLSGHLLNIQREDAAARKPGEATEELDESRV